MRKSCLKEAVVCSLCTVGLATGMIGCMIGGAIFSWRGKFNKAEAFDNYRLEELQKAQEKFDNGQISQSEFDVRVSYINGTEDLSVFRNIWVDEGHQDCCEELYKTGVKQEAAGIGLIFVGVAAAVGASITGYVAHEDIKEL